MNSADETDARITENIGRAARFLDEVFDDPDLLDEIPAGAYVLVADSTADQATMEDAAARMTAAGKTAKVFRLSRAKAPGRTTSGN